MSGGAYSALSGMMTRLDELDRIAADLANVSTSGYKTERASTVAAERDNFALALDSAVDVVRGGARVDFRPGTLSTTGRDLDVAIDGPGFFAVQTASGIRYTRSGNFTQRADGLLVTAEGDPVLGANPAKVLGVEGGIKLETGPVSIAADGTVESGGIAVGRLRIVEFTSDKDVAREAGSRFRAVGGAQPQPSNTGVVGGALEQANVTVVDRMVALTEVTRAFESLQRGISVLMNDIDGRAIAELGRRS